MKLSPAAVLLLLAAITISTPAQTPPKISWEEVDKALGRAGEERDGVYRVTFPRTDLNVRAGGVRVRAGLALTSWVAFQPAHNVVMMMGDLVLTASELPSVTSRLVKSAIEITAVHNHLAGERPQVMYVHFHGHGEAGKLAAALRAALAATATPPDAPGGGAGPAAGGRLDPIQLSEILGLAGAERNGVVSFSVPRAEKITAAGGVALGPRMGVATAINFQSAGSGAAATGDFVLTATEVQPVIRALHQHGIEVTSLHSHMLDDQPRLFFLHFWGRAPAAALAEGLRAALDVTAHAKPR
ncbi:MAG: DUF1259 domain-containing protein [Candidatus Acidiferrales bacterium]